MTKETLERLMKLLDLAMSEVAAIPAVSSNAFDYLSKAMTIVERSYYASELDPRQMELDFNEVDYRNIPATDESDA